MSIVHFCFSRFFSKSIFAIFISLFSASSIASFYQAQTMAEYCHEYIKLIELESSVGQLEAGICSGYIASSIELMDLSGRLCDRSKINLDDVVKLFVDHVESNTESKKQSATYVLVALLQEKYSCEEP